MNHDDVSVQNGGRSGRTVRLELRISEEFREALRQSAAETGSSMALLIREMLRYHLDMPSTDGGRTLEALGGVELEVPEAPSARRTRRFSIRISNELEEALQAAAEETGSPRSLLVREILRYHLDMPSTDGGRTLEALGGVEPEGDEEEPEPSREAADTPSPAPAAPLAAETVPEANVEPEPEQEASKAPPPSYDPDSDRQKLMERWRRSLHY